MEEVTQPLRVPFPLPRRRRTAEEEEPRSTSPLIGLIHSSPPDPGARANADSKIRIPKKTLARNNEIPQVLRNVTENGDIFSLNPGDES